MNYYITHCDKNYLPVVEKLFETLQYNSNTKILFYTVNFEYDNKFDNVIPIYYKTDFKNIKKYIGNSTILDTDEFVRVNMLFLKSKICQEALNYGDYNYCYIDADCYCLENCDDIFNESKNIFNYPLLGENCHEFMMYNGKGDPFLADGNIDLNLCLEAQLLKYLNIPISKRTRLYRPTHLILFNNKCKNFINDWVDLCYTDDILLNWFDYAPYHEETVINCMLWKSEYLNHLEQISINIPSVNGLEYSNISLIDYFVKAIKNPLPQSYYFGTFCKIPSINFIDNIKFLHGKTNQEQFDLIKEKIFMIKTEKQLSINQQILLIVNSQSLGDTIASTPTLRKLYNSYNQKITVASYYPEIFINNKYIYNCMHIDELTNKKSYKQIHETFLGIGGKKNEYGVEKKHNAIDIRQFHALDLGFMLNENEMEYDYIAEESIAIENLPSKYVCMHVSNTWPSRTYSDENWQQLINLLNDNNVAVVLVGKNSSETGFYNIDKQTKKLLINNGLDLTNQLDLSQCWHVINKSECFVTMDSGLLHLAGTTDTFIIQLGSSINNKLRAPYRKNSQDYKYKYISGSCNIFCASDIKYGVKEWGTIQGVPPLITCLENKQDFECHPSPKKIFEFITSFFENLSEESIKIFNIEKDPLTIHYHSLKGDLGVCHIKILDLHIRTIIYECYIDIQSGINYWTAVSDLTKTITNDIKILFYKNNKIIFDKTYKIFENDKLNPVSHLRFDFDIYSFNLNEIYLSKMYEYNDIKINKNDVVVDIGSNLSTFIHYALENNASKIYSCEPTASCLKIINKYFKNNNKVIINDYAISNIDGTAEFDVLEEKSGCNKLSTAIANDINSYHNCNKEIVKTITFKHFIEKNNINKIDFLKIDCEGGENFIFVDENKDFFQKNVHKIALEYHNHKKEDIILYLKSLEFDVYEHNIYNSEKIILGMIYAKNKNFKKKEKILFLAPHLSTGGSPAYLQWLIEDTVKNDHECKLIEYCYYGNYEVQRKQIVNIIGNENFYSFANHWDSLETYNNKTDILINIIQNLEPDIIHLNEISEIFSLKPMTEKLLQFLYNKNRNFKIIETCHTSEFNFNSKKYLPDEFHFCSEYHLELSKNINITKKIVDMQIENKIRPNRNNVLKKLNLSDEYFHVLNVGLFNEFKNQKFIFELAEKLQNKKIMFHFIGNLCYLDNCGITNEQKNLSNCKIWGERNDVDVFMSCMDLFLFPSLKELNPISIKEALSWNMPCYINKLNTYGNKYDDHPLVTYINNDNILNYLSKLNNEKL